MTEHSRNYLRAGQKSGKETFENFKCKCTPTKVRICELTQRLLASQEQFFCMEFLLPCTVVTKKIKPHYISVGTVSCKMCQELLG
jgi:hypothetical protein